MVSLIAIQGPPLELDPHEWSHMIIDGQIKSLTYQEKTENGSAPFLPVSNRVILIGHNGECKVFYAREVPIVLFEGSRETT